eukprot:431577-Pyramimonas_sp.AAC.1
MEWLLQRLGEVDWRAAGSTLWDWGSYTAQGAGQWAAFAARDSTTYLSQFLRHCHLAAVHAMAVCNGEQPEYLSTPSFAPICISWGWLLLGLLLGTILAVSITINIMMCAGCSRQALIIPLRSPCCRHNRQLRR